MPRVNEDTTVVESINITPLTSFVYAFQKLFKPRNGIHISLSYLPSFLRRCLLRELFIIRDTYFSIACSVKEGIGDGFDLASGDPDTLGICGVDISCEENLGVASLIISGEIMGKHPELNTAKIGTNQYFIWRSRK